MNIGLIGFGTIGEYLFRELKKDKRIRFKLVFDAVAPGPKGVKRALGFEDCLREKRIDLWIEAASQQAVLDYAPALLKRSDLMVLSVGALADGGFRKKLIKTARISGKKIYVPSGAIAGTDALGAVRGSARHVVLETRKNPKSLGLPPDFSGVLHDGPADEACRKFPKNVNVAATLSLAGIGFKKTRVRLVAEPGLKRSVHKITASGDFGEMVLETRNVPSKENPRTSMLAAMSAVATVKKMLETVVIG